MAPGAEETAPFSLPATTEEESTVPPPLAGEQQAAEHEFDLSFDAPELPVIAPTTAPGEADIRPATAEEIPPPAATSTDTAKDFDLSFPPPVAPAGEPSPQPAAPTSPLKPQRSDEELPPLGISSRRKSSSAVSAVVIVMVVLLLGGLAGFGYFFLKLGPELFSRIGLDVVAERLGHDSDFARLDAQVTGSSFVQNATAGELLVIRGTVVNNGKKSRTSIQVRATVHGPAAPLSQQTAFCGNTLSDEELATLPLAELQKTMNNQFGKSLANLEVKPGQSVPFVVVFTGIPGQAQDFSVEVAGATPSAK